MSDDKPGVGIIMGSQSDWPTLKAAAAVLDALGVPYETRVVSAHRTPKRLYDYATSARERGLKVIIAGAGGAAHLPGMTASMTELPVLGVPIESRALKGLDSLLSIVQMPAGVPVGTLAIGEAGATNAGLLAAQILALSDKALAARVMAWRAAQTDGVAEAPRIMPERRCLPAAPSAYLGGGQLGRMLALAAAGSGSRLTSIPTSRTRRPSTLPPARTVGSFDGRSGARALCRKRRRGHLRVRERAGRARSRPPGRKARSIPRPKSFAVAQDRLVEKDFMRGLGIPVAALRRRRHDERSLREALAHVQAARRS